MSNPSVVTGCPADLILGNCNVIGGIHVSAAADSVVAIHDETIVAVGGKDILRDYRGPSTTVVDLDGRTITPGLIDAHSHPILGAKRAIGLDLGQTRDADALLSALRREADRILARGGTMWLRAWNLDYAAFKLLPLTARAIDTAIHGLPALLLFFDGHTALASARALSIAGVDRYTRFVDNSRVVFDESGEPTGELREESAIAAVLGCAPALSTEQLHARSAAVLSEMSKMGLTGLAVMDGDESSFATITTLDESASGLPLRIVTAFDHHPGDGNELIDERAARSMARGARWRGGVVKLYADGVIDTGTGWLYEPDIHGDGRAGLWDEPEDLFRTMLRYSRGGLQIATHAIGDRAVGATIDAYLACGVRARNGASHRIEHIECLTDADLARLASAQITASVQPSHLQWRKADGSDEWAARLGPVRTSTAWRAHDLLAAGVPLALGSDWPVAGYDPRVSMAWARLRREPGNPDAPVFEPSQRLSAQAALDGFTSGAAAAQGDFDLGRVAAGFRADLTVWRSDPLVASADEVLDIPIEATIVGGRSAFAVPDLQFG